LKEPADLLEWDVARCLKEAAALINENECPSPKEELLLSILRQAWRANEQGMSQ